MTAPDTAAPGPAAPLLQVRDLSVSFGGVPALTDVDLTVEAGGVVALIGPNGAGKSTLFNCVSRLVTPRSGSISFAGADLLSLPPHRLARLGIARTFQNTALFGDMTVLDNLRLGVPDPALSSPTRLTLTPRGARRREREAGQRAEEALELWGLADCATTSASALDYPRRKRVEVARALMSSPKLLLLDEPAAGLGSGEAVDLGLQIAAVCATAGTTVLLVEHNVAMVMRVAQHIYVLASGRNLTDGPPERISGHPEVSQVFLGSAAGAK